jgi:hypothetical protein
MFVVNVAGRVPAAEVVNISFHVEDVLSRLVVFPIYTGQDSNEALGIDSNNFLFLGFVTNPLHRGTYTPWCLRRHHRTDIPNPYTHNHAFPHEYQLNMAPKATNTTQPQSQSPCSSSSTFLERKQRMQDMISRRESGQRKAPAQYLQDRWKLGAVEESEAEPEEKEAEAREEIDKKEANPNAAQYPHPPIST